MSERDKYAAGGVIKGGGGLVRIERLGVGPDGHCLYSINGGLPERIYTADDVRQMREADGRESREAGA